MIFMNPSLRRRTSCWTSGYFGRYEEDPVDFRYQRCFFLFGGIFVVILLICKESSLDYLAIEKSENVEELKTSAPGQIESWVSCDDGASNHTHATGEIGDDNSFENAASRTCLYRNLCLSKQDKGWVFNSQQVPMLGKFLSQFSIEPKSSLQNYSLPTVQLGLSESLRHWTPSYSSGYIPKHAIWSDAEVAAIIAPSFGTNFGHAMGDFVFSLYRMMEAFELTTTDLQIFAQVAPEDKYLGINFRNKAFLMLSSFTNLLWPGREIVFSGPSEFGKRVMRQLVSMPDPYREDAILCYRRVLAGSGRMGFATDASPSWNRFIRKLKEKSGLPKNENISRKTPRILLVKKSGRRKIANLEEIAGLIRSNLSANVEIVSSDRLAAMTLLDQMKFAQRYHVVITPCGGVSFLTAFMHDYSATIIMSYRLKEGVIPSRMENSVWRFVSNRLVLHYPILSESELVPPEGHVGSTEDFNYRRNQANVIIDFERLREMLEYSLKYIRNRLRE